MDAIAAVSIVLTYVLPHLGGDFLALVHRGERVEAVVGFGCALKRVPKRPPWRGLQSAVVPGYVAGALRTPQTPRLFAVGARSRHHAGGHGKATMHPLLASAIEKGRDLLAADPGG